MAFLEDLCRDFVGRRFILLPNEKTPCYWTDPRLRQEICYSSEGNAEILAIIEKDRNECKWRASGEGKVLRVNIAAGVLPEYMAKCRASEDDLSRQVRERFSLRVKEAVPADHFLSETFNHFTYQDAVDFLNSFYPIPHR